MMHHKTNTMKQFPKILTLIIFSSLFLNLSAQDGNFENDRVANSSDDDRKFRFGLQFNPNISWLKPNTTGYTKESSKFGFSYGLSTEFFLSKNYLFSTGIIINSLGGELSYQGTYEDDNKLNIPSEIVQSYNIKYVEIPLSLKLRTNEIGYMTYYGNFGLRAGIKYKSTSDFTYLDINKAPKVEDINTSSDVFFMNTWLVIGAGAEYNISGNTNLSIGFSYNNGLINTLDTKVNQLDTGGNAALDSNGDPLFTDKNASANISYFSLEIGLYF
jgi:hypothetical protein